LEGNSIAKLHDELADFPSSGRAVHKKCGVTEDLSCLEQAPLEEILAAHEAIPPGMFARNRSNRSIRPRCRI